ncbi:MAG: FHA domain-containing protein [Acidobacteriota bacterium]
MPTAKIKIGNREISLGDGMTSIGRTSDNAISFPEDSNVSRYHAEIEKRDGRFWLTDLGSSNGTQINGERVSGCRPLTDGDDIVLGGSSRLTVEIADDVDDEIPEESVSAFEGIDSPVDIGVSDVMPDSVSNAHSTMLFAGAAAGLVVVVVVVAGAFYLLSGSACDARAVVTKPESGDTISTPTDIEVDVENNACVSRTVYAIDGVEFASATDAPYAATVDPKEFPELADGFDHALSVRLEDENGATIGSPSTVVLAFESREIAKPTGNTQTAQTNTQPGPVAAPNKQVSLIDVQDMSKRLLKLFPSGAQYNVSNKQFLQEVQKRTAEYAQDGFSERAAKYRDAINVAFVREQNLDAPLGFLLAMSRSKFTPDKQGSDEGLWRMNAVFAASSGYTGLCGTETLSDASQNCAAKASSLYMKAMIFGVFEGDVIYSITAYGKSTQDAGVWKASLPANRGDLWNAIRTPAERDQLVRFFAAGIVAENPQKFGLKKDRPLSELYRLAM